MTDAPATPTLDLGWTLNATVGVLRRRARDLFLIALPFVVLPEIFLGFLPQSLSRLQLLSGIPGLVFVGGVSLLTYRDLVGGEPLTAGGAMKAGSARFGTMWAIGFLSGLATLFGLLVLIAPGVLAIVGFMTASTAAMVEGEGSIAALRRAWALSEGSRWRLVGLLGIAIGVIAALLFVSLIIGMIMALVGAMDAVEPLAAFVIGPIVGMLTTAMTTVGSAAAYVSLRTAKEGPAADIATTFD